MQNVKRIWSIVAVTMTMTLTIASWSVGSVYAATAKEIDVNVDVALKQFVQDVRGAEDFLASSKGILVLPKVIQAGVGVGGEYGEGELRIEGKTVSYYNMASASLGVQLGGQMKSILLVFLEDGALNKFRESNGWKVGVDGSVVLANLGAEGSVDTKKFNEPIVGFVFGQKGLMYDLSLEGSKFTKIDK
ncbi:MAG: hypothetical protein H8K07_08000 [Nitrospira sp.]|nr:hypothetical protein [Nitrospira sp.]